MKTTSVAVKRYWLSVMEDKDAPAYRRDEAARQLSRLERERTRQKPIGKLKQTKPTPAPRGKKAQAEQASATAHKGTAWDGVLQHGNA